MRRYGSKGKSVKPGRATPSNRRPKSNGKKSSRKFYRGGFVI